MSFLLYPLLTTATFYLLSQATITSWLWRRYPPAVDNFLSCAACAGTWYGWFWAAVGACCEWSFLEIDPRRFSTIFCVGLASSVWTPILADLHLRALRRMGRSSDETEA